MSDWVKTRMNCTARKMFEQLLMVMESDVKARNEGHDAFMLQKDSTGSEWYVGSKHRPELTLYVSGDSIYIAKSGSGETIHQVKAYLDPEHGCRLHFQQGGRFLSVQEASQEILEPVLFP